MDLLCGPSMIDQPENCEAGSWWIFGGFSSYPSLIGHREALLFGKVDVILEQSAF